MRPFLVAFIAACAALTNALAAPVSGQERTLAIRNATILTGAVAAPIEKGAILVRGGKIAAVGATVTVPSDAEVLRRAGAPSVPRARRENAAADDGGTSHR